MTEVINISWRKGAYYVNRPNWDGGAVVPHAEHIHDLQQARSQALQDAAKAVCGYCKGTRGHQTIPVKRDAWCHLFMVGNGSNPCAAGPIWDLLCDWGGKI